MLRRWPLLALFYFSGLAGLIYQVLWLRRLSLVFGVTVYAASAVLAAFMAGLAIGSVMAARLLRRGVSPLVAFGIAEILVGITGALSPVLLDAAAWLYAALHQVNPESLTMLTVARLICTMIILAVPTTMMGLTLPLLSAVVSSSPRATATGISLLYAVNTLGAMTGTWLAGASLIPAIGIRQSFLLAAALNIAVGLVSLWWATRAPAPSAITPVVPEPEVARAGGMTSRPTLTLSVVVAVSGFAALGLEVVWFRLLLQFVAATTLAFTAMLTTVLGGIAIGGLIAAALLRSPGELASGSGPVERRAPRDPLAALGVVQLLTGVAAVGSMTFLLWSVEQGWKTMGLWQAVLIAILPTSICMGIGFPLALGAAGRAAAAERGEGVARGVGTLYALNVAGAIAGSIAAGFLLLPSLGSVRALILLAALFGASGVWLLASRPTKRRGALIVAGVVLFVLVARDMPDPFRVAIDRRYGDRLHELWRHDGAQTAVSVRGSQFTRVLYLDGLHQANDQPEMVKLHAAIGHLPMVLHGDPREVLVIGMGGGATPGAVSQYPQARIDVVELAEGVRRAASFFTHINFDLLTRPNVHVRVDDGRNYLSMSGRRYDVITADIIQPGHAGAGHVYSREYFTLARHALTDNGIMLQWVGHRPRLEYTLIMRTFLDVFPDATLWYDANLMVGSRRPLTIDPAAIDRLRREPITAAALDAVGLTSWEVLRSWYTGGPQEMRAFVGDGPILTDDRPLVEYHHWLPSPDAQAPLELQHLRGEVTRHVR
jgi:spermidine synthase